MSLPIIGRERMLVDKLSKVLQEAASRHHVYTEVQEKRRGASFDVLLFDVSEATNRTARVTVEVLETHPSRSGAGAS